MARRVACGKTFDPLACHVIAKAGLSGVAIVVSSTWRQHESELLPLLERHGLMEFLYNYPDKNDWMTPVLRSGFRGAEIHAWLERHKQVQNYRIIDDNTDMMDYQAKHLIVTDGEDGMDSGSIKKILNWCGALKS